MNLTIILNKIEEHKAEFKNIKIGEEEIDLFYQGYLRELNKSIYIVVLNLIYKIRDPYDVQNMSTVELKIDSVEGRRY